MNILTKWLRHYLPALSVSDRQLADDLTLRGIAVEGVHPLGDSNGSLFEMDITTNRVDAMNHYGIAREAATIYNLPLAPLGTAPATSSQQAFPVAIEAQDLCGRFTAQVLRDVTIEPSSGLIAEFFTLLNQKQISNAVDASNFTLLGMGHPTHAFDLDKIEGGIIVRLARKGERLRLLDGTERTLEPDDLVVADHKKALALAGVMGGWGSMITQETKNILVEAAWFDPSSVRRSSRRHMLHTDASHRFERGADFNATPIANALVSQLILASGGRREGDLIDVVVPAVAGRTANRAAISLSVKEVRRHLGTTIASEGITSPIVQQYLTSLGCGLISRSEENFDVKLPSWRLDLEREIDLIEEVARVYGYNRFANTLPTPLPVITYPSAAGEAAVRERLLALGYSEAISSSFASESDAALTAAEKRSVPMENPLSEEASLLRPSLVPGMLAMLSHNLNRDVRTVRLFEQGQIFTGITPADAGFISEVHEAPQLSLGLTGDVAASRLYSAEDAPVFELKGVVESLLSLFTIPGGPAALTFTTMGVPPWLQPGRSATALLNNHPIAHFGELASSQQEVRKLRQPVFVAQIDLAALYQLPLKRVTAHELSRYQAVERDFSFVFPNKVQWHTISSTIQALAIPELQSLKPIEVWRNEKKFPGVYSHLIRTVFQSHDRTLTEEEIVNWQSSIIAALTSLGGTLRGAASE